MDINDFPDVFEPPENLRRRLHNIAEISIDKFFPPELFEHLERLVDVKAGRDLVDQIDSSKLMSKTVAELARDAEALPLELLPRHTIDVLDSVCKDFLARLGALTNTLAEKPSSSNDKVLSAQLRVFKLSCNEFYDKGIPIWSYLSLKSDRFRSSLLNADAILDSLRTRTEQELKDIEQKKAEIDAIVKVTQDTAAQAAVSHHAQEFGKIAQEHIDASKRWLLASIALVLVTIAAALTALSFLPPLGTLNDPVTIQRLVTKLVIVSILYYTVVWSAKNYKTHRHLAVVNLHRQSALRTFEAFVKASSSDEQTKNAVLLEATRCIFAPANTGYLGADEENPSNRIIEIIKNVGGSSSSK
jgi:hypothetical protein